MTEIHLHRYARITSASACFAVVAKAWTSSCESASCVSSSRLLVSACGDHERKGGKQYQMPSDTQRAAQKRGW